jgi:hypothetical protein
MGAVKRGRVAVGLLGVLVLVAAGLTLRPYWMRWRSRSALEEAASNLCACMLGRHGDVKAGLLAVRAGIIAKPDPPDRLWPARCKPWGEAALAALDRKKDDSWTSESFLQELQPFWVRDPDPRVPLPKPRSFALTQDKLVPILPEDRITFAIDSDRLAINGALSIDRDDHVAKVETTSPSFPGQPTWLAVEGEPGAKRFWTDFSFLYDDAGHAIVNEWANIIWARSFADGRLVASVDAIADAISHGEIWELVPGKPLVRARMERGVPFGARSTTNIDEWMLYKHVADDGSGSIAALDLTRGAAAKPITLGPVDKTSRVLARTYGTCRAARGTFVDMDPSFLIRTKDGWKFEGLQQSPNRIVSCEGDAAMVTEWIPLEIRKCTQDGCALVPFPRMDTGSEDAFAASSDHLFQVVRDDGTIGVHVYSLANPKDAKHLPVLDHTRDFRLRVVAGRAIVFVKKGMGWAAISVHPDGSVHAIIM